MSAAEPAAGSLGDTRPTGTAAPAPADRAELAADAHQAVIGRPPSIGWPMARFLRSELWLVFGRRRNWAGLAVLAAVPIVIAVAVRIADPTANDGPGPGFFNVIVGNGYFVPLAALGVSLTLLLPVAVATIAGDSVAGEAHSGTLRYLLTVPVDRTRLLLVKYATIVIFTAATVLLVAVVGLLVGWALFGFEPVTLFSGEQVGRGQALLRLLAICGYLTAVLAAVGAVGMFISTLTEQPIGATIATVVLTMVSFILDTIPQLDWLHPYLLTHWWMAFADLLRQPVFPDSLQPGLLSAGGYTLVSLAAAWARFTSRDVTS